MAPEILLRGSGGFGADIWSFGCLAAEVYLGQPLFYSNTQHEQIGFIV